jgi:hypothetical protein
MTQRGPEPAEERKVATVLFADLVGSTALGAEQDPERTRVLLDRFWIRQNSYVSPFALRALGLVRADTALLAQAARTFESMGLTWHAEQTREHRITP